MRKQLIGVAITWALVGCTPDEGQDSASGTRSDALETKTQSEDPEIKHYGISFVWVPAGGKMIGTNNSQSRLYERPQVLFEVSQGFYIGQTEVTADQYMTIFPDASGLYAEGQKPVRIRRTDAKKFCDELNKLRARNGETKGAFRLPYESEWEYVATYGRPIHEDWWPSHSVYADKSISQYENYDIHHNDPDTDLTNAVNAVRQKKPNPIGVYDILGNVSEWCEGRFTADITTMINRDYQSDSGFPEQMPIRGGDYLDSITDLRPSMRRPARHNNIAGFRIVFDPYSDLVISSQYSDEVD